MRWMQRQRPPAPPESQRAPSAPLDVSAHEAHTARQERRDRLDDQLDDRLGKGSSLRTGLHYPFGAEYDPWVTWGESLLGDNRLPTSYTADAADAARAAWSTPCGSTALTGMSPAAAQAVEIRAVYERVIHVAPVQLSFATAAIAGQPHAGAPERQFSALPTFLVSFVAGVLPWQTGAHDTSALGATTWPAVSGGGSAPVTSSVASRKPSTPGMWHQRHTEGVADHDGGWSPPQAQQQEQQPEMPVPVLPAPLDVHIFAGVLDERFQVGRLALTANGGPCAALIDVAGLTLCGDLLPRWFIPIAEVLRKHCWIASESASESASGPNFPLQRRGSEVGGEAGLALLRLPCVSWVFFDSSWSATHNVLPYLGGVIVPQIPQIPTVTFAAETRAAHRVSQRNSVGDTRGAAMEQAQRETSMASWAPPRLTPWPPTSHAHGGASDQRNPTTAEGVHGRRRDCVAQEQLRASAQSQQATRLSYLQAACHVAGLPLVWADSRAEAEAHLIAVVREWERSGRR